MKQNNVKTSRRTFLKTGAIVAGSIVAAGLIKPFNGLVFSANEPKSPGPWYGIGIDIDKCIGCGRCAKACKLENNVSKEPFFFRSWIEQYTVKKNGEVKVDSPNGGIDGFTQTVPAEEVFKSFFVPKMCNHCSKSPCVQVCPVGATFVSPDGVVLIDRNYCIGCKYCIQACPYGCRFLDPELHVADKCSFCYQRLKKGLNPACFEVCPTGARIYGDLRDKQGVLVKFVKEHTCMVLKPSMNTGSKLFYNGLSMEVK